MIQNLAYCALVEEQLSERVPYGLVIYAGQQVRRVSLQTPIADDSWTRSLQFNKLGFEASYYIRLTCNLSWNVSFYGNWASRPPDGLSASDYGSSSGLSWTFGNR